jgi:predicted SAM-dependent methyltransferase
MIPMKNLLQPVYRSVRRVRQDNQIRQGRKRIRQQILNQRSQQQPIRLVVGSFNTQFDGWISTDIPYLDAVNAAHWKYLFPPASIDRILAEHVFEHLTVEQLETFLRLARPYLAPHAQIRLAVPDGYHPSPDYIAYVRPGGTGSGAEDHKVLYNCDLMTQAVENAHCEYRLVEYFDRQGNFHQVEWSPEDGMVMRSADHDRRNAVKPLSFTSLIVDMWPG